MIGSRFRKKEINLKKVLDALSTELNVEINARLHKPVAKVKKLKDMSENKCKIYYNEV